jgi:transposase
MSYFAGLDWGNVEHAACVVDEQGQVVQRLVAPHTREGLHTLLAALARLGATSLLPIAIERPSGLVVDTLVEAGHPVVPIHPNALKACRSRYRAAAGKSDPGDAYILADVLRTDGHRFRPLRPASDELRALRALVRTRTDLVTERVALANQLRALLDSFWPGAVAIFADIDSPIALAFLERFPTPDSARTLGPKRLAAFLARNAYCGRRSPQLLLDRLRSAAQGLASEAEQEAKGELVHALVAVLQTLLTQIKRISAAVEHAVAQLQAGQILMSFPRAGKINAAQILAELGDDPQRFPSEDQLAAEAGIAPVTHESGKSRGVCFRYACNKRLRQALTCFADNSRHDSAWAFQVYTKARARGCDHPHAIRILARAWVRVLWRCWHIGSTYDPARHRAALPFLPSASPTPSQA